MTIAIGAAAPDFTLQDTEGNEHTLSSYKGESPVVLVFVPFAFTGLCESEVCAVNDNMNQFDTAGAKVFGITCDSRFALGEWAKKAGITYPLLSDRWPHGATAQAYDCFNADVGCATRCTVVIDADGNVADVFDSGSLAEGRSLESYEAALAKLS